MPGGLPICVFDSSVGNGGMFRVIYSKGKALSNGGYGVTWTREVLSSKQEVSKRETKDKKDSSASNTINQVPNDGRKSVTKTFEYLFIEEAVYLHECGLLEVYRTSDSDNEESILDITSQTAMDTQELYALMLNELNFPLSVYLTYSHLRSQMYRVIRHSKHRLSLLKRLENADTNAGKKKRKHNESNGTSTRNLDMSMDTKAEGISTRNGIEKPNETKITFNQLKRELRKDIFEAPIPYVLYSSQETHANYNGDSRDSDCLSKLAFDVWNPDSSFRKTNPGLPDFVCAITCFAEPSIRFSLIRALVQSCGEVPLRLATVADGGTVIMFGLTDYGVPPLKIKQGI